MKVPDGWVVGIDLAWGETKADGVCFVRVTGGQAEVDGFAYPQGDDGLVRALGERVGRRERAFVAVDAPLVCPNLTGSRPVDRLTHTLFHREHAACHPANLGKCPRPPRVMGLLAAEGFRLGWNLVRGRRLVSEVYPHPAMVRLFRLERILKYKRGLVTERRAEFERFGRLVRDLVGKEFPELRLNGEAEELLRAPWSKPVEDRVDAMFCALIGLWHWKHGGQRSEVIGDLKTGFILLPEDLRKV
ncbi:MAG: DUF429 domain-containing protein [Candidatus Methylacidiphilales bacterium]